MLRGELAMTEGKRPDWDWRGYNEQLVRRRGLLEVESLRSLLKRSFRR